jgi:hypothetical protein
MAVRKIPVNITGLQYVKMTSWGTVGAGSYASLRAANIKFEPKLEKLPMNLQKHAALRGPDNYIVAGKGGTITFDIPLQCGIAGTTQSIAMDLLETCGTVQILAGTTGGKISAATTSTATYADTDYATASIGDIISVDEATSTQQTRYISDVTDDGGGDSTMTVEPNFANAPTGDDFIAMDTWIPQTGEPSAYLAFKVLYGSGATDRHQYLCTNCAISNWKIKSTSASATPFLEIAVEVDTWISSEASVSPLTADTLNQAHPLLGDIMYIDNAAVAIADIEFDAGLSLVPYSSTAGTNGRAGWLYNDCQPKLSFTPWWDTDWNTKLESGTTNFSCCFESVRDADESWCLIIPSAIVASIAQETVSEHYSSKPEIISADPGGGDDDGGGAGLTDIDIPIVMFGVSGKGA